MSALVRWSYVRARLQARHGDRLKEADWRMLEAAQSIEQFIERARASALRRFTERLNARQSSHAVERAVRAAWREYVDEVADWVPPDWRSAVLWASNVPDLPVIEALLQGKAPEWVQQDAAFAGLAEGDARRRSASLAISPLAPLFTAATPELALAERWRAHWRSLWRRGGASDHRQLVALAKIVQSHVKRLSRAAAQETSGPYRRDLTVSLTRLFRRHSESPVAVFCHLALVALDLERLRGGLVRRLLFAPAYAKEAA